MTRAPPHMNGYRIHTSQKAILYQALGRGVLWPGHSQAAKETIEKTQLFGRRRSPARRQIEMCEYDSHLNGEGLDYHRAMNWRSGSAPGLVKRRSTTMALP